MTDTPVARGSALHMLSMDFTELCATVHKANIKWWQDSSGEPIGRNFGELVALMHSELSEALEANRKSKPGAEIPDSHLPQYPGTVVELVDCIIRVMDTLDVECARIGVNPGDVFAAKMTFNAAREDHSHEHRSAPGGKAY